MPNLSSIVVLAELGGKRMLLTGDARGDKILEGLELAKALGAGRHDARGRAQGAAPRQRNNLETDFFERITADHYVFSGNGEHGNPERRRSRCCSTRAAAGDDFTIHLTYPIDEIDAERKKDWEKERQQGDSEKGEDR